MREVGEGHGSHLYRGESAGEGKDRSGPHLRPVTKQLLPKPWEPAGVALSQVWPTRNPKFPSLRSGAKLLLELGTGFGAKWQVWVGGHSCVQGGRKKRKPKNHYSSEMAPHCPHQHQCK